MFPSPKLTPPPTIKVYRSNTATITFEGLKVNGEDKTTISNGESILLVVKSPMGTTVLSKTLVGVEGEEIPIQFELEPEDTLYMFAPFKYHYSVDLYNSDVSEFLTLQKGDFILEDPVGDINDIKKETNEQEGGE